MDLDGSFFKPALEYKFAYSKSNTTNTSSYSTSSCYSLPIMVSLYSTVSLKLNTIGGIKSKTIQNAYPTKSRYQDSSHTRLIR